MDSKKNANARESAAKLEEQLTSHFSRLQSFMAHWSQQQELIIKSALEAVDPSKSVSIINDRAPDTQDLSASLDDQPFAETRQSDNSPAAHRSDKLLSDVTLASQRAAALKQSWLIEGEDNTMWKRLKKIIEGDMAHYHDIMNVVENDFEEKKKKRWLQWFVSSPFFEAAGNLVIIVNALVMAFGIDYALDHPLDPRTPLLESLEIAFTAFYTTELILKIIAEGAYFVCSHDVKWNLFDAALVLSALYEVLSGLVQPQGAGGNVSFLRVIKLAKMVKTLRVLRVLKSFRGLRLIVASMLNSVTTVFWSALLIVVIAFTVSVMFAQSLANYLSENADAVSSDMLESKNKYWRTVLTGMVSLYMASTGGQDWVVIAEPVKRCGTVFYMLFLLYIMFFLFVIVNTLASIFVEATIENANRDDRAMIQSEMRKKNEYIHQIKRLFHELDVHKSGHIEKQQFMEKLKEPQMLAFFSHIGIDAIDAADFLDVLMREDDHAIDVDKFVLGCMKLKGPARSMDLLGFIHAHDATADSMHNKLTQLSSALMALRAEIKLFENANMKSSEALLLTV